MLIYTIFLLMVGWLGFLFHLRRTKMKYTQFNVWPMRAVYECGAYLFFFVWMQAKDPLVFD